MNCRAVGLVFDDLCAVRQNVDTRFGLLPVKNAATGERVDSLCGSRGGARHFGDAAGAGGDEVERYDTLFILRNIEDGFAEFSGCAIEQGCGRQSVVGERGDVLQAGEEIALIAVEKLRERYALSGARTVFFIIGRNVGHALVQGVVVNSIR